MSIPDDLDLRDFDGVTRLFPLPSVVLLPHNILALHIFEPRYRQMTEDALAGDRLVSIVQVRSPVEWLPSGEPVLEDVACLGRIVRHERLADGRFNFLLLGRKRIRLIREVPTDKLYRSAEVEVLDDRPDDDPHAASLRVELSALFRASLRRTGRADPDVSQMLDADPPLGVLTDVVAHFLGLPAGVRQAFLADADPSRRASSLIAILRQVIPEAEVPGHERPARPFPPDFSPN